MEVFTWFSVFAFIYYGIIEIDDPFGSNVAGTVLISIAAVLTFIQLVY